MQTRSFRGSREPVWVSALPSAGLQLGLDPRRALGPAVRSTATTGRTRDRTRPILHQPHNVLARAPSTRDPNRTSVLTAGSFRNTTGLSWSPFRGALESGLIFGFGLLWPGHTGVTMGIQNTRQHRCIDDGVNHQRGGAAPNGNLRDRQSVRG